RIITRRLLPFRLCGQSLAGPFCKCRCFEVTGVANGFGFAACGGFETGKVSDHPLAVMEFPVKRCLPVFAFDCFPAFGKPPAEVLISTVADEFEKVTVGHEGFIEREIASVVTQRKQSSLDLCHTVNLRGRLRQWFNWRIELIAQEMLDVVNE